MSKSSKTTTKAAPIVRGRGGRIAPLMDDVLNALTGAGATVASVAARLSKRGRVVTERDVRLAIDKARAKMGYEAVERVAPGTFRFAAAPKRKPASRKPASRKTTAPVAAANA